MWRSAREFATKHRAKLIGALVIGIGATAWMLYSSSNEGNAQESPLAVSSGLENEDERR